MVINNSRDPNDLHKDLKAPCLEIYLIFHKKGTPNMEQFSEILELLAAFLQSS